MWGGLHTIHHTLYTWRGAGWGVVALMLNQLRGRNLAHVGCLIGCILGLGVGIVLAAYLATLGTDLNRAVLVWGGLTILLGGIGWVLGSVLSQKYNQLPPDEKQS